MVLPGRASWDVAAVTQRSAALREEDFARLFEEYSSPIYNYVLRMVADADRAADITQDTFIKAYRKLDTVTDAAATRSWLYRIATNTAIDDMRRRRMTTTMPDDAPTFANRPDDRP
jgi:RNA polymerase sigma-70 factor (ECF subfamily)